MGSYPRTRLRRLRDQPAIRDMTRETRLSVENFIYPIFVTHGRDVRREIDPMPGMYQFSLDHLIPEIGSVAELGIRSVLLFGIPAKKDPTGAGAYSANGIVQEAVRMIKQAAPELLVFTDVCLCEYTDHGYCGAEKTVVWTTTKLWSCWRQPRSPTRRPAPTSWRPPR